MPPTRITVLACLLASLVVGAVACGIDAVGKKDVFEATPSPPGPSATAPGTSPELDASTGTVEEDASIGVIDDAGVDAFFDDAGDAATDAPVVVTSVLELSVA